VSRKSRQRQNSDLGFVSVRVMADYGSSGLWLTYPPGWYGSSGISCEALRLPAALSSRFAAWIETYVCQTKKTFDPEAFNRTGRELAQALKEHLGPQSYVEFVPEPQNDDDAIEIEIIE
jgi:hypothetical protein